VYLPPHFGEDDVRVLPAVMRDAPRAALVTCGSDGLHANHVPMMIDPERGPYGTLVFHLARANPQWRDDTSTIGALAIFTGPDAYVSPGMYATKAETGKVVPTWNYVAVHAYGRPRLIEEPAALRSLLAAMVQEYEASFERPWDIERLPEEYVQKQMRAIVGLELPISRLEGKRKLSQNRTPADQAGVAAALRVQGDPLALAVADEMG